MPFQTILYVWIGLGWECSVDETHMVRVWGDGKSLRRARSLPCRLDPTLYINKEMWGGE